MRAASLAALAALLLPAAALAAPIPCSDIPMAQKFIDTKLKPGPNTRAAQHHLDLAKKAKTESECSAELAEVDKYARRSAAADKRASK
ncbi:MAG TPA: hypothetical protein VMC10_07845 [Stellaceae bacterium]|nr:hypothetical protein [Stellaceae bacterium]